MGAPRTADAADMVRLELSKWGGRPHYHFSLRRLGEDEHGVWLWAPVGNVIRKGDSSFQTKNATITLVPRPRVWWNAAWWLDHDEVDLYVNVNTPPEWHEGEDGAPARVSMIDLDLDVIRFVDGRVEIVDRDEFDAHRVEYGYPPDVVDATIAAAEEVRALVEARTEPFDEAHRRRWLEAATVSRLPPVPGAP